MNPVVSVIIPAFNVSPLLAKCIDSVIAQEYDNLEIIIVDDGSDDDTRSVANSFAGKDKRVRVIAHDINKGTLAARISGIQAIDKGEYVLFLDSDDILLKGCIASVVTHAQRTGADVVHFATERLVNNQRVNKAWDEPYQSKLVGDDARNPALELFLQKKISHNVYAKLFTADVVKNSLLKEVVAHAHDKRCSNGEDFILSLLLFLQVKRYEPLHRAYYLYCIRDNSSSGGGNYFLGKDIISKYRPTYHFGLLISKLTGISIEKIIHLSCDVPNHIADAVLQNLGALEEITSGEEIEIPFSISDDSPSAHDSIHKIISVYVFQALIGNSPKIVVSNEVNRGLSYVLIDLLGEKAVVDHNHDPIQEPLLEDEPQVSVLIPAYNVASLLSQCMESILSQNYNNLEIIIVDDGSNDDTLVVARSFEEKDKRVKVYAHEKNKGNLGCRITGYQHASGEYVFSVDADDYIEKNIIAKAVKRAKATDADIVHFGAKMTDIHGTTSSFLWANPTMEVYLGDEIPEVMSCPSISSSKLSHTLWGKLIKTSAFRKMLSTPLLDFNDHPKRWVDLLVSLSFMRNISSCYPLAIVGYTSCLRSDSLTRGKSPYDKASDLQNFGRLLRWHKNHYMTYNSDYPAHQMLSHILRELAKAVRDNSFVAPEAIVCEGKVSTVLYLCQDDSFYASVCDGKVAHKVSITVSHNYPYNTISDLNPDRVIIHNSFIFSHYKYEEFMLYLYSIKAESVLLFNTARGSLQVGELSAVFPTINYYSNIYHCNSKRVGEKELDLLLLGKADLCKTIKAITVIEESFFQINTYTDFINYRKENYVKRGAHVLAKHTKSQFLLRTSWKNCKRSLLTSVGVFKSSHFKIR